MMTLPCCSSLKPLILRNPSRIACVVRIASAMSRWSACMRSTGFGPGSSVTSQSAWLMSTGRTSTPRSRLEQRPAEGLAEDGFEVLGRIRDLLESLAPTQIGLQHVALDRSRTHDRALDDEIVEALRLGARQHRQLRAALDLEHAERVG